MRAMSVTIFVIASVRRFATPFWQVSMYNEYGGSTNGTDQRTGFALFKLPQSVNSYKNSTCDRNGGSHRDNGLHSRSVARRIATKVTTRNHHNTLQARRKYTDALESLV